MEPEVENQKEQADELEQFEAELSETAGGPQLNGDEDDADQQVKDEGTEAEPTGEEPEPADDAGEPIQEPEPAEETKATLYSVPDHEKFGEFRGKKLSAAQLEEAGLLDKFVTWQHQSLLDDKIRQKNKDLEERLEEVNAKLEEMTSSKQEQPVEEPPKEMTPEEVQQFVAGLRARYGPHYKKAVETGAIEEDIVEFYPKFLAVQEHRFQAGQQQINLLRDVVLGLAEDYKSRFETETTQSGANTLITTMDSVAKSNEGFGAFAEEDVRSQFVEWFATDKNGRGYDRLPVQYVNEKIMEDAYMAFMREFPDLFVASSEPAPKKKARTSNRHLAQGGGAGSGGSGSKPILDELQEFEEELNATRPM